MSSTAVSFFLHRRSPPSSSPRSLFSSFFHFMSSLLSLPPRRCYSRTAEDNESPVKIPSPLQDKWILLSKLQYESWPLLSFVFLFSSSASFFFFSPSSVEGLERAKRRQEVGGTICFWPLKHRPLPIHSSYQDVR